MAQPNTGQVVEVGLAGRGGTERLAAAEVSGRTCGGWREADFHHQREQERQLLAVLTTLASCSQSYLQDLEQARPHLELLCQDYPPTADLVASILVAQTMQPGSPTSVERLAVATLRDLHPRSSGVTSAS